METTERSRRRLNVDETVDADSENASLISPPESASNLSGDEWNIAILFFLYVLQGIPLGLSAAIPMYLQNRGVSYRQQAEFSLTQWPFSMKLLWAPIVDSVFHAKFGRRKSWMVPSQYLIGLLMFYLSFNVDSWLGAEGTQSSEGAEHAGPNMAVLTFFFFLLNFLAATQDIAVDGWALTMLQRRNVGHASTCNSVGQTAGYFLGYVVFMGLESPEFCNAYLRSEPQALGLVTLPGFLFFWSIVFVVTTTLVALMKREDPPRLAAVNPSLEDLDIKESYTLLWRITQLPSIRLMAAVLLTAKIGFCACDAVTSLKLIDAGVPKEKLALMAVPLVPLQIVLPLVISKYTVGPRPMDVYLKAMPYRLWFGLVAAALVWVTPFMIQDHVVPISYYVLVLGSYSLQQVCLYAMYVSVMAFFARVSDPTVGGTYMTLLNTLANLGGNWPATLALWLVDSLTFKDCQHDPDKQPGLLGNSCADADETKSCLAGGGRCETRLDGYYVESAVCFLIGWLWLAWGRRKILELQAMPRAAWQVPRRRRN